MEALRQETSTEATDTGRAAPYETLPECYGQVGTCPDPSCALVEPCADIAETQDELATQPKPDYAVIDRNTGEMAQLSLLGAQWEAYKVETTRYSLSGGEAMSRLLFDSLVAGGELSPGAVVRITASGVVKEHAPIYKKGEHEGKTIIVLNGLNKIEVLGHMTGKVEAAQNVDGEPKVLEEEPPDGIGCHNCRHEGEECRDCEAGAFNLWEPKDTSPDNPERGGC
ncbi:MAG: hypothetical protein GX131_07020 [candidate division WS1 bacterium]|nr:hypothetical protein [candidate division WS1 bacterium]